MFPKKRHRVLKQNRGRTFRRNVNTQTLKDSVNYDYCSQYVFQNIYKLAFRTCSIFLHKRKKQQHFLYVPRFLLYTSCTRHALMWLIQCLLSSAYFVISWIATPQASMTIRRIFSISSLFQPLNRLPESISLSADLQPSLKRLYFSLI